MISKALAYLKEKGPVPTLNYAVERFKLIFTPPETPGELRSRLSATLSSDLNHTVIAGLFAGLVMQPKTTWGSGDRASHLLGTYEQEVQHVIGAYCSTYSCLIDIGAADGYFAVGCVAKKIFHHCHAFEAEERSRANLQYLADLNSVSDSISVHGVATRESLFSLPESCRKSAFFLVDIEGGEFELLSSELIQYFSDAFFIVELHPAANPKGCIAVDDLRARFSLTHQTWTIGQGARDPGQFEILRHLHENERWLLVSENRGQWMEWLIAKPLES